MDLDIKGTPTSVSVPSISESTHLAQRSFAEIFFAHRLIGSKPCRH